MAQLTLVRDCWWIHPTGVNYIVDETGAYSTYNHGLYNSIDSPLGTDDSKYIEFKGDGVDRSAPPGGGPIPTGKESMPYCVRLNSTNIIPDTVNIAMRAYGPGMGTNATAHINGVEIGEIGGPFMFSPSDASGIFNLTDTQKERVLNGRVEDNYDYFQVKFTTGDVSIDGAILYDMEVYYSNSGDATWANHETGLPNVQSSYYHPTQLGFRDGSVWIDDASNVVNYSGVYLVDSSPNAPSVDSTYIEHRNTPTHSVHWTDAQTMPNGGLSLYFDDIADSGVNTDPIHQVTRATLNLRMALPNAGSGNVNDAFEINLYNHRYKNQDNKEDMLDAIGSISPLDSKYGYFAYGAGDIINQVGFTNYTTELNFLDPFLPSGNIPSILNRNIDIFANAEMQIVGLPSGVQISSAELYIESLPNKFATLYIPGSIQTGTSETFTDYISVNTDNYGNGAWHHRGNLNEAEIFDAFYDFSEGSGTTINPITTGYSGVYGEFLNEDNNTTTPTWYNYYRNPIVPSGDTSLTVYRDAVYSLDSDRFKINFDDRMDLDTDFTLYFMIYVDPHNYYNNGYDINDNVFYRGDTSKLRNELRIFAQTYDNNTVIQVAIYNVDDTRHMLQTTNYNYGEPILIWLTSKFDGVYTTVTLNTHSNPSYYYSEGWNTDTITMVGQRLIDNNSVSSIGHPQIYVPMQKIGIMEFGWDRSAIDLYDTSYTDYATSSDASKRFFASRVANTRYIHDIASSGVKWVVPSGTSSASWSTSYKIDNWLSDGTSYYEIINPVTTAGTNYVSHSGAIVIDIDATHITNHPSGVNLTVDLEFDSGSIDKWKVWRTEFSIPSGSYTATHIFDKHINMGGLPINVNNISNITLGVKTEYVDTGDNYFGDLQINSIKTHFETSQTPQIQIDYIYAYTHGSPEKPTNNIDLFAEGCITKTSSMDLYTYGIPSAVSGDFVSAYIDGGLATINDNRTLFIQGLQWPSLSGSLDLYTWSTANSGFRTTTDLYTASLYDPKYSLPLYTEAPIGDTNTNLNLYINNDPWTFISTELDNNVISQSGVYINVNEFNEPSGTLMFWMKPYTANTDESWWKVNQWQHVAVSWDESADSTPLYVDGALIKTDIDFSTATFFDGKIADWRGYDEILTTNEILSIISETQFVSGITLFAKAPSGISGLMDYGLYVLIANSGYILLENGSILSLYEDYHAPNVTYLSVRGKGVADGYYPSNTEMPMYIERDSEAVAHRVSLYLGQHDTINNLDGFIMGHEVVSSSTPLYIKGSGEPSNTLEFYTHGF